MADRDEIQMPEDPARLVQHGTVDVLLTLCTAQGEERVVFGGRCTTQHCRPNGAILTVKPQLQPGQVAAVKRGDRVRVKLRKSERDFLEGDGTVSWVRPRAFLPSGLAVMFVGVTFDWDAEDKVLEVAAFLPPRSLIPPARP